MVWPLTRRRRTSGYNKKGAQSQSEVCEDKKGKNNNKEKSDPYSCPPTYRKRKKKDWEQDEEKTFEGDDQGAGHVFPDTSPKKKPVVVCRSIKHSEIMKKRGSSSSSEK